jgi:DNA-binding transcriptional LysR family regulator
VAGPIRLTAGDDRAGLLANLLHTFLARYPKVQIDVELTPRFVDLIAERFDLALRAGRLVDSSLIVRRLGRTDLGLFASRAYVRDAGRPTRVTDLTKHRFVLFGEPGQREQLHLTGPDGTETVKVDGPLIVHGMTMGVDAISAGIGIGLVPEPYFGWLRKAGRRAPHTDLVRLLPDHAVIGSELSLVSPPTAYEPVRVALLRDFLASELGPLMKACTLHMAAEKEKAAAARQKSLRTERAAANS